MGMQEEVHWTVPETFPQMHLLTFPLFQPVGQMGAVGPWLPSLHLDMAQTLPVQQFHRRAHLKRSCINCPFNQQQMNFTS